MNFSEFYLSVFNADFHTNTHKTQLLQHYQYITKIPKDLHLHQVSPFPNILQITRPTSSIKLEFTEDKSVSGGSLAVVGPSRGRKPAGLFNFFTCGPKTGVTSPHPRAAFTITNSSAWIRVMAFEESWGRKARFQPLAYFLALASVDPHVRCIPLRKAAVKAWCWRLRSPNYTPSRCNHILPARTRAYRRKFKPSDPHSKHH